MKYPIIKQLSGKFRCGGCARCSRCLTAVTTSGEEGGRAREGEKIAVYVCRSELHSERAATVTEVRASTSNFGNEGSAALASG